MRFIAFDLETTGFIAGVDKIIEIGAVRFVNGKPEAKFSTLIDPLRPIPPDATKVNGITDEMVKGQPTIESILNNFADFCGTETMVAHNATFDAQFLIADIKAHESQAPQGVMLDTLSLARKAFPGLANYKLSTLTQHLKIESKGFHRAEEDASYCGFLFDAILKKIFANNPTPPVEDLVEMSGKAKITFPQIEQHPKQMGFL